MMADIAMCLSEDCPSRDKCYRHEAVPDAIGQVYGDFESLRDGDKCERFIPLLWIDVTLDRETDKEFYPEEEI